MGLISFRSYWTECLLELLHAFQQRGGSAASLSVKDLSLQLGFKQEDIVNTLAAMNLVKFWKGQHVIVVSPDVIAEQLAQLRRKARQGGAVFEPQRLLWQPKYTEGKRHHRALRSQR